jgi:uncharacterized protein
MGVSSFVSLFSVAAGVATGSQVGDRGRIGLLDGEARAALGDIGSSWSTESGGHRSRVSSRSSRATRSCRAGQQRLAAAETSLALGFAAEACYVSRTAIPGLTQYGTQTILQEVVARVIEGDFEWDDEKALSNLDKHGVSFPEAATVFADPAAVYLDDGSGTDRMVVVGTSLRDRVLYVVHVERGRRDRIISARPATRAERDVYESGDHT